MPRRHKIRRTLHKRHRRLTLSRRIKMIERANPNAYIPERSEIETSNHRDVALLEHGWAPEETKFGEPFKGKNKILISEEK